MRTHTHTYTHTTVLRLSGFCPGQPGWAGTRRNILPLTPIVVIIINRPLKSYLLPPSYTTPANNHQLTPTDRATTRVTLSHPSSYTQSWTSSVINIYITVVGRLLTAFGHVHRRRLYKAVITSAEEGGYVFGAVCLSVCLSVRRITRKLVNGFWRNFLEG